MVEWEVVIDDGARERAVPLASDRVTIGRAPDNDVVLDSQAVSQRHAELICEGTHYRFRQIGRNPTTVFGIPADGRLLEDGDVIDIAPLTAHATRMRFRRSDEPPPLPTMDDGMPVAAYAPVRTAEVTPSMPSDELAPLALTPHPRSDGHAPTNAAWIDSAPAPAYVPRPAPEPVPHLAAPVVIGRDRTADVVLTSPLVSRRHAEVRPRGDGAEIADLDSGNGTFVNGERISKSPLFPGDVIRVGPYRLIFDGAEVRVQDAGVAVTLTASHLTQRVNETTILNDVSFACFPGEITAIGGTSGAGKTTLMDALTGLRPAVWGSVLLNGSSLYSNFESLRAHIGYVPQSNILHQDLPLEHALQYAAKLRLPPDTDDAEIHMRVQASMHPLDLTERAELAIRNLSGGQQKRASIAMELLTEPSLFFLDEPTSGLDPGLSVRLMRLLRHLADAGKTVLLVSHDPESFAFCDQLIFLSAGGRVAYAGPPAGALEHFGVETYAEMYDRVESESTPEEWQQRFIESPAGEAARQRLERAGAGTSGTGTTARTTDPPPLPLKHQAVQLTKRYAEVLVRDTRNMATLLGQAPIIGLLLILLAKPHALTAFLTASGVQERSAREGDATKVLLLLALTAVWLGTINASREIVKETAIWRRERLAGVAVVPYLGSKLLLLSVLAAAQNLAFLFVVAMRVELPHHGVILGAGIEFYVTLLLASIASVGLGLALSAAAESEERAITLVPLALIPQIMFAGIIFKLNGVTQAISWLFVTRWAVKALGATANVPGYEASGGALLGMWLVLVLMTGVFLYVAAWLINRREQLAAR
jgi:ABC-type multidrug transport system ATPase subunit/pSer/pThr/pTyr-binding forkhead associated (FHA) protein/ABC-type multidrug transport system permease subunit